MSRSKVVQTELSQEEYDLLVSAAKEKRLSIKEAAKRAIVEWGLSTVDLSRDPLLRLKPTKFKTSIRADRIEEFLYRGK